MHAPHTHTPVLNHNHQFLSFLPKGYIDEPYSGFMEAVKKVQHRFRLIFHTAQDKAKGYTDEYYPQNVDTVDTVGRWYLFVCGDPSCILITQHDNTHIFAIIAFIMMRA